MGSGLGGGSILGGILISFTGIRTAYQLFAGIAFMGLIIFKVLPCLGNENDEDDQTEVQYQAVSCEDPEDMNRK